MAQKTEKLEQGVVENITSLQNKAAEQVHILGEFHIRLRELEAEKKRMQEFVSSIEVETDMTLSYTCDCSAWFRFISSKIFSVGTNNKAGQ